MTAINVKPIEEQIRKQVDKQAEKLDKKRHVVGGKVTQAKGFAQEKLGELTHNDRMRRAGRRQQVKGKLQERGWFTGSKPWLVLGTAVALIAAFFFFRGQPNTAS
jgi:uncharacterized protein YjbJ (UPF0337 family)